MNEQFISTSLIPKWSRDRNNSLHSQEYSIQTRTTILIQDSKKQDNQSTKKIASLRAIPYLPLSEDSRESKITIICTVRDEEQGDCSLFSPPQGYSTQRIHTPSIQTLFPNKNNQRAISKYKYIKNAVYRNQNLGKSTQSSSNPLNQTSQPLQLDQSLDTQLQLIEQRQQFFQYKTFMTNPHLIHYANLSREEQIQHLLSNDSFISPNCNTNIQINTDQQINNLNISSNISKQFKSTHEQMIKQSQKAHSSCYNLSGSAPKLQKNTLSLITQNFLNKKNSPQLKQIKRGQQPILVARQSVQSQSTSHSSSCSPSKSSQMDSQLLENTSSEAEILILAMQKFFEEHSIMKRDQIYNWIDDRINSKQPHDNYIHKFIFHKKYKDFETEEQKYQGVSRFHNLNRMFMHNIIKILVKENLQNFDIPITILNKIISIVTGIKNEAFKKYNNGKSKTCFFNHYHYNLLFLQINSETLRLFTDNSKDLELHRLIIGVDLQGDSLNSLDVQYCNLIKYYIFRIVNATIEKNIQSNDYNNCVRLQYVQRVLQGIKKLSEGLAIKRF